MSRMIRGIVGLLSVLFLLAIPSAVFATEGYTPVFYAFMTTGDKTELVKISGSKFEKIADIESGELPLTIEEAMPDIEVKAFQADVENGLLFQHENLKEQGIYKTIKNLWAIKNDEFLLHHNYWKCGSMPEMPCYGYTEFTLLNTTTDTERVLWTLPYHQDQPADDPTRLCYQDVYYENYSGLAIIEDVNIHPTRDLFSLHVTGCQDYWLLIDYSTETPRIQKWEHMSRMSWSPDGRQMAYIENKSCDGHFCTEYGRMSLETGEKKPFQQLSFETAVLQNGFTSWIEWLDDQTIVYAHPLTPAREWATHDAVVWHNLSNGSEVLIPFFYEKMPMRVFRLSDENHSVLYSETWIDGETLGWNTILTNDPFDIDEGYQRVSSANSRNTRYAVASICSGLSYYCDEAQPGFIDVEGNLTKMNLEYHREAYKADHIQFAAVAVDQP